MQERSGGDQHLSKADHEHMAMLVDGSQTSWGKLYDRHGAALLRFCGNFTNDPHTAEEWAQETFLRLKEKAHLFQAGAEVKPWLYKIARNICLQNLRKKREIQWSESLCAKSGIQSIADSGPSPLTKAAFNELSAKARSILDGLSEEQRTVFLLKYMEGLSREDIAEAMSVPESTVKSRLFQAMLALREEIEK